MSRRLLIPLAIALLSHPALADDFDEITKVADTFKIADGLKISLFAAEPDITNPVCLWVDDTGRVWVVETFRFDSGRENNGVYDIRHRMHNLDDDLAFRTVEERLEGTRRWNNGDLSSISQNPDRIRVLEDRVGDGRVDSVTMFADDFRDPMDGVASGILVRGRDVYFANIPHLWLLRDTTGDGRADFRKSLSYGYGVRYAFLGHDLHGLRFGPDGKLYFSIGDRGLHVKTPDGRVLDNPDSGAVLRCDPDGSNLEVFAIGLRNPQELAFDQYGNLFTGDNNADFGDPARWVYLVEGGDSGWRIGYQQQKTPTLAGPWLAENLTATDWKHAAAYLNPPVAHIAAGPSGLAYYPGTGLSQEYDERFFLCDFRAGPASVIHSFKVRPRGAGFELVDRKHLVERMVATDIDFGPDGAIYITDWIEGFIKPNRGRVWRVVDPQRVTSAEVLEVRELIANGFAKLSSEQLAAMLAHRDMRIRQGAQFELAARGRRSARIFHDIASKPGPRLARLHAIWGLGQIARQSQYVVDPLVALLSDPDDEVRAQVVKVLGEARYQDAYRRLIPLLEDPSPRVRFFAALSLGKLHRREAIPHLLRLLEANANEDPYLRHAAVMGLTGSVTRESAMRELLAASDHLSSSVRLGVLLTLRRLERDEIARFLDDPDPRLVLEAARAINDVPIEGAFPQLAALMTRPPGTPGEGRVRGDLDQPVLLRSLNANFRLGERAHADIVAAFAMCDDAPEVLRVEAIAMLADWTTPRRMDRVMGVFRPLPPRDPEIAAGAFRAVVPDILATAPAPVRVAAINLCRTIPPDDPELLVSLVTSPKTSASVAAAALSTMDHLSDPQLDRAIDAALASGKGALRASAIQFLARRPNAVPRLEALLDTGSIAEQQAVFATLAQIEDPAAAEMLTRSIDKLIAGDLRAELHLDLLEAAGASKSKAVRQKLRQYEASRPSDDPVASRTETLFGGDASLGRRIFFERADVSCLRCHRIDGEGGIAGPDLTGLALRLDRVEILESVVDPNRRFTPGFEATVLKTRSGQIVSGVVRDESESHLVLDTGDGTTLQIDKSDIAARNRGLSPMPSDIAHALSHRELRDLIEFLATLNTPADSDRAAGPE